MRVILASFPTVEEFKILDLDGCLGDPEKEGLRVGFFGTFRGVFGF